MSQNKSIRDFFKPKPAPGSPEPSPAPEPTSTFKVPSPPATGSRNVPASSTQTAPLPSSAPKSSDQRSYTSSLSPPPSGDTSEQRGGTPLPSLTVKSSSDRVIQNSDDEDDSDTSLEDLSTLLAARHSSSSSGPKPSGGGASTPPKYQTRQQNFPISPLAVLPKYKFDLKALISHKKSDDAAEASAKRFKAMLEKEDEEEDAAMNENPAKRVNFDHSALLDSVVAGREDGRAQKVKRALKRTEATVTEERWYFFDTQSKAAEPKRKPFPVKSVPEGWKSVLVDPQMRQQTFLFGFAEDMVSMGQELPDELFLWMLDEVSVESNDALRTSYFNIFRRCHEQTHRIITPKVIEALFRNLGGTTKATTLTEIIKPVQKLTEPYLNRDWAKLLSSIRFFGQSSKLLSQTSRTYILSLLLRMSVDKMVFENVDIHDQVQETISRLCHYIPEDNWNLACTEICKSLFDVTQEASLQLQITDSISSITPRSHDLRRRLAMCFFFSSLTYSTAHSHTTMSMDTFIDRLNDPLFDMTPTTNYRSLASLVYLLDIAIDDAQHTSMDLTHKPTETRFNNDIEELSETIKAIMSSIKTGGVAYISRMEAKEALEVVSRRIADTLRTKPKPRHKWFERKGEDLAGEKKGMAGFLAKKKSRREDARDSVSAGASNVMAI